MFCYSNLLNWLSTYFFKGSTSPNKNLHWKLVDFLTRGYVWILGFSPNFNDQNLPYKGKICQYDLKSTSERSQHFQSSLKFYFHLSVGQREFQDVLTCKPPENLNYWLTRISGPCPAGGFLASLKRMFPPLTFSAFIIIIRKMFVPPCVSKMFVPPCVSKMFVPPCV